jgi:phosphatidylinositol-3-phosphatase
MGRGLWIRLVLATLCLVSGCDSAQGIADPIPDGTPVPMTAREVPRPDHVVIVVFENKTWATVTPSNAPYLTSLAEAGAHFTDAHGVAHPSQPNYIALFSGSTQDVADDSCPRVLSGPNLASELLAAGRTFTGYSEDLPAAGSTACESGAYHRKHNPWVDFRDLPPAVNQPLTALPTDFDQLPTVAFVVPNLCNDMHDCSVARGDRWAEQHLSGYVDWAQEHNSLLVVTFDESEGEASANHILTVLVGPMVREGDSDQPIDHYSVLRTVEEMYGLPPLGLAANREPITDIWTASSH